MKRGTTVTELLARAGEPDRREGAVWHWRFGHPDGPLLHLRVTVKAGKVVDVAHTSAGCVLNE